MLRHPARHYIYYLLSKRSLKNAEILGKLDDLCFPLPQKEVDLVKWTKSNLIKVRQLMTIPPGFDPLAETMNKQTIDFLAKWKIGEIWRNDPFVNIAMDLLGEPLIRRMLEALLLGPMSPADIAERVKNRFGLSPTTMNVRVVRVYSHYFWDISALNTAEWKTLIFHWLENKFANNDYLAALNAPRSAAGVALTLALVDRSADSLSPLAQYSAFRDQGFAMFMEHALLDSKPSLQRTQAAFLAFQMVRMADEELTKHRGGSSELVEEFRRLEAAYDTSRVTSVKDMPQLQKPSEQIIDLKPVEEEAEVAHDE